MRIDSSLPKSEERESKKRRVYISEVRPVLEEKKTDMSGEESRTNRFVSPVNTSATTRATTRSSTLPRHPDEEEEKFPAVALSGN